MLLVEMRVCSPSGMELSRVVERQDDAFIHFLDVGKLICDFRIHA